MMYIRFIFLQLQYIPLFIIGLFVYPVAYVFRYSIYNYPTFWKWGLLYWFTNSDEDNFINNWYGIYEIYNSDYTKFFTLNWFQKFILSYKWGAIRNPHYSYQLLFAPIEGVKYSEQLIINEGEGGYWNWRNKTKHGKQFVIYRVMDKKYFRFSFTKKLKLFGYTHINFQAGAGEKRFILKIKLFKL